MSDLYCLEAGFTAEKNTIPEKYSVRHVIESKKDLEAEIPVSEC